MIKIYKGEEGNEEERMKTENIGGKVSKQGDRKETGKDMNKRVRKWMKGRRTEKMKEEKKKKEVLTKRSKNKTSKNKQRNKIKKQRINKE